MFGDGFEQATILRAGPDGLTRIIVRTSWSERESVLVEASEAQLFVLRQWEKFSLRGARVHADVELLRGMNRPSVDEARKGAYADAMNRGLTIFLWSLALIVGWFMPTLLPSAHPPGGDDPSTSPRPRPWRPRCS
jgi:hypothetical protein